jgi:hypothetical protein
MEQKVISMKSYLLCLLSGLIMFACKPVKTGDSNDFREFSVESLTAENAPEGLEFRDNSWSPSDGWELVQSKDGQRVMLLQTGTNTGSAGYECKCNAGTGACTVRKDIVMCVADECTDCSTVLKIYNQRFAINRADWN